MPLIAVALVLIIISIFFCDQRLSTWAAQPNIQEHLRRFFRDVTDFGLSEIYFIISVFGFLTSHFVFEMWLLKKSTQSSFYNKIHFFKNWCVNLFAALIISGIATHLTKFLVGRARPHKTENFDPLVFEPFNIHWHWQSMPSGHSQTIFAVATMMSTAYPQRKWMWYGFGLLIAFSRIITLDHSLSDTIAGALIGHLGTLYTIQLLQKKTKFGLKYEN